MRRTCFALALTALVVAAALPAGAQTTFAFQLFGQAQHPPVETDAYGTCSAVLSADETTLTLSCEHNVANPLATHIHQGFADQDGPVIIDLGTPQSPIQATVDLDAEQAIRLLAGGLYVNVHSDEFPGGEIRGQLTPGSPIEGRRMSFPLRGSQEVPPVETDADGACVVEPVYDDTPFFPPQNATLHVRCAHDVDNPIGAHIHDGGRGENAGVLVGLGSPESPIETTVELNSAARVQDLLSGGLYVNVHSETHAGGEVRGQMDVCIASPDTLCFQNGRFSARLTWNTKDDAGDGVATQETLDSGMFWFFRPTNLEMLIKVLNGCVVNDHFWVFLAPVTNVGFNLTVTDHRADTFKGYSNTRGQQAQPTLDTMAFATCP